MAEFLQITLRVFIRVAHHVNRDNQMQQTAGQRAFLKQIEQFIHQRDAG